MKKSIFSLSLAVFAILLNSCTADKIEETTKNLDKQEVKATVNKGGENGTPEDERRGK